MPTHEPSVTELKALADHARQRVALYRRRVYLGRGDLRRLAELEREADGAAARLRRAQDADGQAASSGAGEGAADDDAGDPSARRLTPPRMAPASQKSPSAITVEKNSLTSGAGHTGE